MQPNDCEQQPNSKGCKMEPPRRRLEDVFSVTLFVFKTSSRSVCKKSCSYVFKTSWKINKCYTEDVFSTSSPRRMFAGLNEKRGSYVSNFTPIWSCIEDNVKAMRKTTLKLI